MIRLIELFAGIGACSKALENLNIPHEIVDAVEIDKYAITSFNALHGTNFEPQDITKWDKDFKDIDLIMHGSPCFVAGTKVITSKGYKNIEEIEIGDEVLTHKNRYMQVTNIGSDGEKPIFKIQAQGILPILCTENHPFLVRHKSKVWNNLIRKYEPKISDPEKVRVYDLKTKNNYIGVPIIPTIENDFSNLGGEILWLLGRYVADGHIDSNRGVILSIGKDKINQFDAILSEYKKYSHTQSCYHVIFNKSSELYNIVSGRKFGDCAKNKKIPIEILQLSVDKLRMFLLGYMSGDGCRIKRTTIYQATTISRELAESLVLAVQKVCKVGAQIYYTKRPEKYIIEGRTVNQKDTYTIRFNLGLKSPRYIVDSDCIWYPIKKITKLKETKKIYNITVEDDHTYTANNCYCFNCQDYSMAGKQAGGDKGSGTRSSLMYESVRIIEKIKPKYVVWENVKNLLSKKHKHNFDAYLETMSMLGYNNYYKVLNAKDYGIPQNRERIFTISIRKDIDSNSFKFPEKQELTLKLKDMLDDVVDDKYYLNNDIVSHYTPVNENGNVIGKLNMNKWQDNMKRIYDINKYAPTINTMQGGNTEPKVIVDNRNK